MRPAVSELLLLPDKKTNELEEEKAFPEDRSQTTKQQQTQQRSKTPQVNPTKLRQHTAYILRNNLYYSCMFCGV